MQELYQGARAQCFCPADCPYHRTGQYSYRIQSQRVRSISDEYSFHLYLIEMEKSIQRGEISAEGIRVFHQGHEFSL